MTGRVILVVGAIATLAVLGIILLAVLQRPIPDALPFITSAAVPGLIGLLVKPEAAPEDER